MALFELHLGAQFEVRRRSSPSRRRRSPATSTPVSRTTARSPTGWWGRRPSWPRSDCLASPPSARPGSTSWSATTALCPRAIDRPAQPGPADRSPAHLGHRSQARCGSGRQPRRVHPAGRDLDPGLVQQGGVRRSGQQQPRLQPGQLGRRGVPVRVRLVQLPLDPVRLPLRRALRSSQGSLDAGLQLPRPWKSPAIPSMLGGVVIWSGPVEDR